jgi:hypothetical protein
VKVTPTGDWKKALAKLRDIEKRAGAALQRAVLAEANEIRAEMVKGIDSGSPGGKAFAGHAPATPYLRRATGAGKGGKILIASAAMRNSITVVRLAGGGAFVGVHRSAGKGRFRIAEIQETGRTINVTPRMRRFLHAMLRKSGAPRLAKGGGAKVTIRIPPRRFIGPIVSKYKDSGELEKRLLARVSAELGLGGP